MSPASPLLRTGISADAPRVEYCCLMNASTERARLQSALHKLAAVLSEIVATAEQKSKQRCPYRSAHDLCTFVGGCQNQRRDHARIHCAGDYRLH